MEQPFVLTPRQEGLCAPLEVPREPPAQEAGTAGFESNCCSIGRGSWHTVQLKSLHCSSHGVLLWWPDDSGAAEPGGEPSLRVKNKAGSCRFVRYWPHGQRAAQFLGPGQVATLHDGDTLDVGIVSCESGDNAALPPSDLCFTVSRLGAGGGDVAAEMHGGDAGEEVDAAPAGEEYEEVAPLGQAEESADIVVGASPQVPAPPAPQPEPQAAVPEAEEAVVPPQAEPPGGSPAVEGPLITSSAGASEPSLGGSDEGDEEEEDDEDEDEDEEDGSAFDSGEEGRLTMGQQAPMDEDLKPVLLRGDTPPADTRHKAGPSGAVRTTGAMQAPAQEAPPPKRQRTDAAQPQVLPEAEVIDLTGDE